MGRQAKQNILLKTRELNCAVRLAEEGARTGVLYYWTNTLTQENVRNIIRDVTGRAPKSGMMPHSVEWFRNGKDRLIQSKLFLDMYESVVNDDSDTLPVEQFERGLNLYQTIVNEPLLNVNIADNLLKLTQKSNLIHLRKCKQCKTNYLEIVNEYTTHCQSCQWDNEFFCRTPSCHSPLPKNALQQRKGKKRQYCDACNLAKARARQKKSSVGLSVHACGVI